MNFEVANSLQSRLLTEHRGFMALSPETRDSMRLVNLVFPFRVNNYVLTQLINWSDPNDPIFRMVFPQKGMLIDEHLEQLRHAESSGDAARLQRAVADIRRALNPHPGSQMTANVPTLADGTRLLGLQHKYARTVLVFPRQAQTCHTYCTFCFRWPQFVGDPSLRMETSDITSLIRYLREHPEVTDLLFTGGDPFMMPAALLKSYVEAIVAADLRSLSTIRFGTKALTYWPFRLTADADAADLLDSLQILLNAGKHVTVVGHFTHPRELQPLAVRDAIGALRARGVEIRTQTPMLRGINDSAAVLAELWQTQVVLGCIPYYLFVARDTGAQHFFGVPLAESCSIYREALEACSGLAGTVRGPVMSSDPGKIEVLGIQEIANEKVFQLRFLQARQPEWSGRLFCAEYDSRALWLSDLKPAFNQPAFFFER